MSLRAAMCRWLVPILCLLLPGQAMAAGVSSGSMRFDVHYGAQGFKVGEARHDWKVGPKAILTVPPLITTSALSFTIPRSSNHRSALTC